MSTRLLWALVVTACLAGCADPPGVAKPKPLNYQEEHKASEIYHRYASQIDDIDGVLNTYLTASNNPRRVVVVVADRKARSAVREKFGKELEGLKIRYEIADRDVPDDEPIEAVPTAGLEAGGFWGQVVTFFASVKTNFSKQVFGQPAK